MTLETAKRRLLEEKAQKPQGHGALVLGRMSASQRKGLFEIAKEWYAGEYGSVTWEQLHAIAVDELGWRGSEVTLRRIFGGVENGKIKSF